MYSAACADGIGEGRFMGLGSVPHLRGSRSASDPPSCVTHSPPGWKASLSPAQMHDISAACRFTEYGILALSMLDLIRQFGL